MIWSTQSSEERSSRKRILAPETDSTCLMVDSDLPNATGQTRRSSVQPLSMFWSKHLGGYSIFNIFTGTFFHIFKSLKTH